MCLPNKFSTVFPRQLSISPGQGVLTEARASDEVKEVTRYEKQILKVIEKFEKQGKKNLQKDEFIKEFEHTIQQEMGLRLKEGWKNVVWQKLKEMAQKTIE